jgi:hypothetical protein
MSRQNLKDAVEWIGKDMTSAGKKPSGRKKDPAARAEMNYNQGQIFIISEKEYIGEILPLYGITIGYDSWIIKPRNRTVVKSIFADITTFMKGRKISPPKGDYKISKTEQAKALVSAALQAAKYKKKGDHVFVVPTFESTKGAKYKGKSANNISTITARHLNKHLNKKVEESAISEKHQLGHGDKGVSVAEYNVVSRQQLAAKKFNLTDQEIRQLDEIYVESKEEHIDKINIKHAQEITSDGKLKKSHALVLTMQSKEQNKADRDKEADFMTSVRNKSTHLAEMPGSTKLRDAIEQTLMWNFKPGKGIRVIGTRKKTVRESSRAQALVKSKRIRTQKFNVIRGIPIVKSKFKSTKAKVSSKGRIGSPMQARGMFNATISEAVRENMGGAALHNVSGRFADSVHIHNIMPHKGTSGIVQYTYMYNPYKVFEGHDTRDPRLLIDNTIREQAAEMALGKFTTQRL